MCDWETLSWIWLLSPLFSEPSHNVKRSFYTRNKVHVIQPWLVMNLMLCDNRCGPIKLFLLLIYWYWYTELGEINTLSLKFQICDYVNLQLPVTVCPDFRSFYGGRLRGQLPGRRSAERKKAGRLWGPVPASTKTSFTLGLHGDGVNTFLFLSPSTFFFLLFLLLFLLLWLKLYWIGFSQK